MVALIFMFLLRTFVFTFDIGVALTTLYLGNKTHKKHTLNLY